jgi:lysyl-tRNA synthetase class 1
MGIVYETAGKDHFTEGGSRTVAVAICSEVFKFPPPRPSDWNKTGLGYEFFTVGGKKMSTSKGFGVGFRDISEHVPPKILRYLLVKTRPRAVLDFEPSGTNKMLLLYENYDRTERIYFGKEKIENQRELEQEKRIYELSHVGEMPKKMPEQISLSDASMIIQAFNFNMVKALAKIGRKDSYAKERLKSAEQWVREFAPEQYKFMVQEKIPEKAKELSDKEKEALHKLADIVEKNFKAGALENAIYEFSKKELSPKEVFKASYIAMLGKEKGPRLAPMMLCLDKEFIVKRFKEV